MKIEKLSENQIRCTLDKDDLEQRQLQLSELAKGSSKAREALHEMIQQAANEFGFEVENIPLMVEAMPISNDSLVLIITKIDDPEKLEDKLSLLTRLAELMKNELQEASAGGNDEDYMDEYSGGYSDIYDDDDDEFGNLMTASPANAGTATEFRDEDMGEFIDSSLDPLGLLAPFTQAISEAKQDKGKDKDRDEDKDKPKEEPKNRIRLYTFQNLDQVIRVSALLAPFYQGESILYKESDSSCYYLFLNQKDTSADHYRRACMIASEFGMRTPVTYAASAYCMEHCTLILGENAIGTLNKLNG